MKVLLFQRENLHTETAGFFLSLYKTSEIFICHKFQDSPFNWIAEYSEKIGVNPTYIKFPNFNDYDKIIFLTSRDIIENLPLLKDIQRDKVIQIRHTESDKYSSSYPNYSLSPLVKADNGNFLTVFSEAIRTSIPAIEKLVFSVFGLSSYSYPKKDVQGLIDFAIAMGKTEKDFVINVITKKGEKLKELENIPGINMLYGLDAKSSGEVMKGTHFIMPIPKAGGAYYRDRMTGVIPMSLSYGVPMYAPQRLLDIYKIKSSVGYENDIREHIEALINMSYFEYTLLTEQLRNELRDLYIQSINTINNGTIQLGKSTKTPKGWF
jgi:hypothetical protein